MTKTPISDYRYMLEELIDDLDMTSYAQEEARKTLETVVKLSARYALSDLEKICKAIRADPLKGWPSPGNWAALLKEQWDKRNKTPRRGEHARIGGYRYDQIMATRQGKRAKAQGRPHSFLHDVKSGKIPIETLDFPEGERPLD